jgi:hypothetical protein
MTSGTDAGDLDRADSGPAFAPLIDHTDWHRYEAALDPLNAHQPAEIDCGIAGYFVEAEGLEVDTGRCNYLLIEHAARANVEAGDELHIELRHFDLTAVEPATAHVALLAGDDVQWETTLVIPSAGNVLHATVPATRDIVAGEPIRFHLHNHGQNTYLLVAVEVGSPALPRSARITPSAP